MQKSKKKQSNSKELDDYLSYAEYMSNFYKEMEKIDEENEKQREINKTNME